MWALSSDEALVSGLGRRGSGSDQAMDLCPPASFPLQWHVLRRRCEACGAIMFRSQPVPFVFQGGGSLQRLDAVTVLA